MTSAAYRRAPIQPDSIAVMEWYIDSHPVLPVAVEGSLRDGRMQLYDESWPGQIPYRALLPPDMDNLMVPVCVSSTHVAYQTIRLEATWMHISEAAAIAAVLAIRSRQSPAGLDSDKLLRTLAEKRVMLTFFNDVNVAGSEPWIPAAEYFGAKGFFPDYDARANAPLDAETAEVWANGLKQLLDGKLDPRAQCVKLTGRQGGRSGSIQASTFARMLSGKPKAATRSSSHTVTRAEALLMMWSALPRKSFTKQPNRVHASLAKEAA